MPEDRVELAFPFGGLNDSEASTDSPSGTTNEAINVRPYDPITGRRRGSQRSGLANYSLGEPLGGYANRGRVQAMGTIAFDNTRLTYTISNPPTEASTIITPAKGTAYAVVADKQNNIWAYDGAKTLVKYSPEGVLLDKIGVAVYHVGAVVTRLRLDEFGALYACIIAAGQGSIQKFEEDEDRGWTRQWGLPINGEIRDFDIVNDMLYITVDTGSYLTAGARTEILTYAGLAATVPPVSVWSKPLPHPVHAIKTVGDGSVYFTCPENLNRVFQDPDSGTFNSPVIDWTPGHLLNANERIHYWVDASVMAANDPAITDGENIPSVPSLLERNEVYNNWESLDRTQRVFNTATSTWYGYTWPNAPWWMGSGVGYFGWTRTPPKYKSSYWGVMPALWSYGGVPNILGGTSTSGDEVTWGFPEIPGDCMASGNNVRGSASGDKKTNLLGGGESDLEHNLAPIPGNLVDDVNQKFIFAFVGRVKPHTLARSVVFSIYDQPNAGAGQETGECCIAMIAEGTTGLANEGNDPSDPSHPTGMVSIVFKGATFTDSGGVSNTNTVWVPFDLEATDDEQRFILTIVADSANSSELASLRQSAIRINGRAVDSVTIPAPYSLEGDAFANANPGSSSGHLPQGVHGRMTFGSPVQGSALLAGDQGSSDIGSDTWVTRVVSDPWVHGSPAWVGNWNHTTFGGPAAGYTAEVQANVEADLGAGIENCVGFHGDICEILTVLADSTGSVYPNINNSSTNLVPKYSDTGFTAKRGEATCNSQYGTTDVEKIEGYLAWKWGIADVLPKGIGTTANNLYADHPFASDKTPPPSGGSGNPTHGFDNTGFDLGVATTRPITGKLDPTGNGKWAVQAGGMGYGLEVKEDSGEIYTVGPCVDHFAGGGALDAWAEIGTTGPNAQAWKLSDRGTYASGAEQYDGWFFDRVHASDELSSGVNQRYPRLALDTDGNLYWPLANQLKANHVRRLAAGGRLHTSGPLVGKRRGHQDWQYSLSSECQAFGVAVTTDDLDFRTSPGVSGPEFIWISSDNGEQDGEENALLPQLHKVNQFRGTMNFANGVSSRETRLVAVSRGSIYSMDSTTRIATLASNGADVLDTNGAFVSSVPAFEKLYFADGLSYQRYDPVVGTVEPWTAEKGQIPRKCKLVSFWRGRMIVARDPEDPHNWHMSAMAEPNDWDFNPRVFVATMAINGNNSRAGRMPDIVNTIIPYDDDLLLFGCDSNIYRLTGDPMAGGQLDMVSSATGMGFGQCWCRDPEGVLYFFGSRGGVYRITPEEGIVSLTAASIERRMQDIDLTRYKVRLIWNTDEQGLHVIQAPIIDDYYGGVLLKSWFWDRRNNAWFEDEYSDPAIQPSSAVIFDGDSPDDRTMILGCEDGFLREYSRKARNDSGFKIDSRVLFGPLVEEESLQAMRFGQLGFELATGQNGAQYDWHVSRSSDVLGPSARSGHLRAGPNPLIGGKFRGAASWVRLRNASQNERWSLESLSLSVRPAGRKRI